jgi:hypothetical protein
MKEKILLIAGGSDPAGSEIDGTPDSTYNRQHSFGNQLALRLDRKPINIAMRGVSNGCITRSVLEWFDKFYDENTMDVFVLVGWANSSRMEAPFHRPTWYNEQNPSADWVSETSFDFLQVQHGNKSPNRDERDILDRYNDFIIHEEIFLEILSANYALQLQYFFKMKKIPYLLVNTLYQFTKSNNHIQFYLKQIDSKRYLDFDNNEEPFYYKYAAMGYKNLKAQYFHHSEEPHLRYAEHLQSYIKQHNLEDPNV